MGIDVVIITSAPPGVFKFLNWRKCYEKRTYQLRRQKCIPRRAMKAKTYLYNADGTMPQTVRTEFSDDVKTELSILYPEIKGSF